MIESGLLKKAAQHIDPVLRRRLTENLGPGIALALTTRDKIASTSSFGVANQDTQRPVTDRTLFQIGSITKHFTAVACMRLAEQGRLDVAAPVTETLDWFQVDSAFETPITTHHLLTHTAGLVMMMDSYPSSWWQTWALRETKLGFEPGSRFSYSNVGYNVLQCIIQTITGTRFSDALRELVFEPLGMDESYGEVTSSLYPRMAQGHKYSAHDDRPVPRPESQFVVNWYELSEGCGSVVTTATDLSIFLRMLLNEGLDAQGHAFLSADSFAQMTHPHAIMEGFFDGTTQGYGLLIEQSENTGNQRRIIGGGENLGFEAAMYGDFETGVGVVLLINSFDVAWKETRWIMDVLLAASRGKPLPEWTHPAPSDPSIIGERADDYVGAYTSQDQSFELINSDGSLMLHANGKRALVIHEWGENFATTHLDFDHAMLTFARDDQDQVVEVFQLGERFLKTGQQAPSMPDYPAEWDAYVGHFRSFGILITNFRVFVRRGTLMMKAYSGYVDIPLTPLEDGVFRSGGESSPERLIFDSFAGGRALRCRASGCDFYRIE